MKMFKQGSVADEVSGSMEKELLSLQGEENKDLVMAAKAAKLLNEAGLLFIKAGMTEEAEDIANVMSSLTQRFKEVK